ncbi:glycosyltransferase family 2 protein [Microbacterium sp. NPDC076911]|uniref:glycosyltransferase family 2 protein n=1 Tax=Microbacterium sp. NPDC076911 TaxID=3154958 RepID=UPI00344404CE
MTLSEPAAVTIIVPAFNVEEYVADALRSLQVQTIATWSAILIDDGSDDATADILDRFAAGDSRFRIVRHDARHGLGTARNTGLDLVDTPLLGFLDADDILRPAALERMTTTLTETGSDFVAGAYVRLRANAEGRYEPGAMQPWVLAATDPARRAVTLRDHPAASGNVVAWSKISRTDFWRKNGLRFPEGTAYEDQVVAQMMYTRARAFDVISDVVVEWRERADGSSITQHKAELPVLLDYLEALRAGLAVLDAAGAQSAAAARVPLILMLDLPPLIQIASEHPVAKYRQEVGAFAREIRRRTDAPSTLPEPAARALALAAAW